MMGGATGMVGRWVGLLAAMQLEGLLLLAIFALAALVLRRSSAAGRHWAWFLGVASLLLLPFAEMGAPSWTAPLTTGARSALTPSGGGEHTRSTPVVHTVESPRAASEASAAVAASVRDIGSPDLVAGHRPKDARAEPAEPEESSSAPTPGTAAHAPFGWEAVLMALWGVGALLLLARLIGSQSATARLEAESPPFAPGRVTSLSARLSRRLGLRRTVRLLAGEARAMPVSWGWLRPVVLLPPEAERWPDTRLTAVLLHELAHVRRSDCLTQTVAEIAVALHWPNPLVWVAAARLRVEREYACDDLVLRAGARASAYADELLALARSLRVHRAFERAAVAMSRPATLSRRLRAVLDATRRRRLGRGRALAGTATAGLLVLSLAAVSPVAQRPTPSESRGREEPATSTAPGSQEATRRVEGTGHPVAPPPSLAPALQAATCGTDPGAWTNVSSHSNDDHRRLEWSKPGCEVDIRVDGDIRFTDDFRDVARLGRSARLLIEETEGRTERSLEITAAADGTPRYEYRVDRDEHPFDAAARSWYEGMLLQVFRRAGFMARERVASLLRQGGVPAVLRELDELRSDYVFSTYAQELLDQADDLTDPQALDVVRRAHTRVDSDYYLASILEAFAPTHLGSDPMLDEYLAAAGDIDSDYYRSEVLVTALDRGRLSAEQVGATLHAAAGMDSDYYVSEVLTRVAKRYALAPSMRETYLDAVSSMDSDYYRSEVLLTLLDRSDLSDGELAVVLRAAGDMTSDSYVAGLLAQAATRDLASDELRSAYLAAAAGIDSDSYGAQALNALVDQGALSDAQVADVVAAAAADIDSDYYKAEVLGRVARKYRVEGATREAMIDAMNGIDSDYYRGQVAQLLVRR